MDMLKKLTSFRAKFWQGDAFTPPPTHRSGMVSSVVSDDPPQDEEEEIDLIALQTTPEQFQQPEFDVGTFELNNVGTQCTSGSITELKDLRIRQLHVQVQQLVHHVTANTDNLTAGIQTCQAVGSLLHSTIKATKSARKRLKSAGGDATTSLKVAALYKRNQQLASMMELCSNVLLLQQKAAEADAAVHAARTATHSGTPGSIVGVCEAMIMLSQLSAQFGDPDLKPLSMMEPLAAHVQGQQSAVETLIQQALQNVCSRDFTPSDFDRLVTLHVLNVRSGADLPQRIRDTFLSMVSANDQYAPGERPPSLLQSILANDRAVASGKGAGSSGSAGARSSLAGAAPPTVDGSLTALYRAIPTVKFRGVAERIMQTQFSWMQTFHATQLHVAEEQHRARAILAAVQRGAVLEADWSSGMPLVRLARRTTESSIPLAQPSGAGSSTDGCELPGADAGISGAIHASSGDGSTRVSNENDASMTNDEAQPGKPPSLSGMLRGRSSSAAHGGVSGRNGSVNLVPPHLPEVAVSLSIMGTHEDSVSHVDVKLTPRLTEADAAAQAAHPPGMGMDAPAIQSEQLQDDSSKSDAQDVGTRLRGTSGGGSSRQLASISSVADASSQVEGHLGSLSGQPLSLEEFVKQRERILHGVSDALRKCRVEFGRQAARNIVKMYEACTTVQSEAFHGLLRHGLDFAAMVTAFCAERPDELENDLEALPHDYLLDVVKTACGQRLFHAFAREQRDILMADLLPIEQCEAINARAVKKVADAASGPVYGSDRANMTFSWWATAHSFQHRSGDGKARRLHHDNATVAPSPESLKLVSDAVDSTVTGPSRGPSRGSIPDSQMTPIHSNDDSALMSHKTATDGGVEAKETPDDPHTTQRVILQATRHITRAWSVYGALLPLFRSTADVPRVIVQAIQSLFEEYMLWTVVTFAGITPTAVVRGVQGKHARFFKVVRSLMLRSDRSSRTKYYEQQFQVGEQAERERKGAGGASVSVPDVVEMQEGVGRGGGTLDRLVRGTIACDALATLARDLLELEPILREQCAASGDEEMLRVIAELFENTSGQLVRLPTGLQSATGTERVHGCVHEVESVRRRCVEGSVIYNLGTLGANVSAKLRLKSYAGSGLTDASNVSWLNTLRQDLSVFVEALVCCTESRSLAHTSLQEIWMMAVLHIDKVVLSGLAECVEPGGKFAGLMSSMANVAKSADKRHAKRGLSSDGCMQLAAEVSHLVRLIALAQPEAAGTADVYTLMTVNKWAEGCHNEMVTQQPTMVAQDRMIEQWMSWAATCHRGTPEGKAQCLALFNAVQRLKSVPDSCQWVRDLKAEVLA